MATADTAADAASRSKMCLTPIHVHTYAKESIYQ